MSEPISSKIQERHTAQRSFVVQLERYRDLISRRWWIFVVCLALALVAGVAMNRSLPAQYNSVGQMIVSIKLNISQSSLYTEELGNFLGTQSALMQGTEVQKKAQELVAAEKPNLVPQPVTVDVSILPKTSIFVLRASGGNPEYTKAYLQACMESYIDLKKNMAERTSDTTIAGLTDQMLLLEPKMQKIDDQLAAFLATNDVALLEEAKSVGDYLTTVYQQLAVAQSQVNLLNSMTLDQSLLLQGDAGPLVMSAGMQNVSSPTASILGNGTDNSQSSLGAASIGMQYLSVKEQIQLFESEQERYAQYLKPSHPKMVTMDQQLERLGRVLNIYRTQSTDQIEARKTALNLQITNLQTQIKQLGLQNIELSRKSAEYGRIKAKGDRLQLLYDQLLATLETLDVNKDINPETVTVYQPASDAYPDPSLPRKRIITAGLLGLGLGIVIFMMLARVDDRIGTALELQEYFDEDILGQIPRESSKRGKGAELALVQLDDARHSFVEAYRNLRSSLLYMAESGIRPHTLLVTSSVPNDGKSVTAANLAAMLAMGGSRVLLVDADLRKGNLHNRLKITADGGLSEALQDGADWRKAVRPTATANLSLLPRGRTTQRSSELFIGDVMKKFLADVHKEYDYVIIDTPPVMAADDVTSLAPRVDGVVFVIRAQYTSMRVAHASLEMLYQRKARVLGLVFNSVRATSGDYYYYYRYKDYYAEKTAK